MFDISFSELVVIALVALLVIGPEKLPKVARTAGAFFGRLQRFMAQVKEEVQRESRFEALQQLQAEVNSSLQQEVNALNQSIASPQMMASSAPNASPEDAAALLQTAAVTVPKKPVARRKKNQVQVSLTATIQPAIQPTIKTDLPVDAPVRRRGRPKKSLAATDPSVIALSDQPPAVSPAPKVRQPRSSNKAAPTE